MGGRALLELVALDDGEIRPSSGSCWCWYSSDFLLFLRAFMASHRQREAMEARRRALHAPRASATDGGGRDSRRSAGATDVSPGQLEDAGERGEKAGGQRRERAAGAVDRRRGREKLSELNTRASGSGHARGGLRHPAPARGQRLLQRRHGASPPGMGAAPKVVGARPLWLRRPKTTRCGAACNAARSGSSGDTCFPRSGFS